MPFPSAPKTDSDTTAQSYPSAISYFYHQVPVGPSFLAASSARFQPAPPVPSSPAPPGALVPAHSVLCSPRHRLIAGAYKAIDKVGMKEMAKHLRSNIKPDDAYGLIYTGSFRWEITIK